MNDIAVLWLGESVSW